MLNLKRLLRDELRLDIEKGRPKKDVSFVEKEITFLRMMTWWGSTINNYYTITIYIRAQKNLLLYTSKFYPRKEDMNKGLYSIYFQFVIKR